MPVFVYEARDPSGALRRDVVEAPNVRAATQKLQDMKYTVITIKERSTGVAQADLLAWFYKMRKVNEQALVVFSRQYSGPLPW